MSGPQLTALAATVVACLALVGVVVLLVRVRRLRVVLGAAAPVRAPAPAPVSPPPPAVDPAPPPSAPESSGQAADVGPGELVPMPATYARPEPVIVASQQPTQQQIVAATLAHPLVRVSAFSYGVRRALRPENRDRLRALVRRDLRRRHKLRRRAARMVPVSSPPGEQDRAS